MVSTNFKRRRRRTGSTAHRYSPAQAVRSTTVRHRIGATEIAGAIISFVIAVALIVLIWMVTSRSIQDQRDQVRDLAQRNLIGQASVMAESVAHELLLIDQSLKVLQQAWDTDSGLFDINKWKAQMPALTEVTDDVFIADEKRMVKQDILPQAVGQGIASAYVSWPHGELEKLGDSAPRIGSPLGAPEIQSTTDARRFIMYIVRPLARPPGWMIGASFRTAELGKLYNSSWFGTNALAGIVDLKSGGLQSIVGPAARHPERSLAKSELFANMVRGPDGIWIGESPIDGVLRIHAFHRVPNRDMAVVVAATETEAMQSATLFAAGARGVAFAATATTLMIAGVIGWTLYHLRANRRRQVILTRNETELARLHQDEERLTERAHLQSARLRALVENASDGIALVDPNLRLIRWNRRFEQGIGVPLEQNMPLDAILRHQATLGLFDPPPQDVEVEIARRAAELRSGETAVVQIAIGHEDRFLRGLSVEDGGLILLLTGVGNLPVPLVDAPDPALAEPGPTPASVQW